MEDRPGGMSSGAARGHRARLLPPVFLLEARGLQFEHGTVAAARGHQLIVRAQLDHPAVFQDADAVGMAHGREAVRNQDGGGVARGGQNALEDFRFAAHVELGGGFIQQHHSRAQSSRRTTRAPGRCAATGRRRDRCRLHSPRRAPCRGSARCAAPASARAASITLSGAPAGRNIVAQRQLEADEILEHGGDARAPGIDIELAQIDAVDLDRAALRIVEAAQQFRERGLPAPFCPTMASEEPAGIVRSKPSSTGVRPSAG